MTRFRIRAVVALMVIGLLACSKKPPAVEGRWVALRGERQPGAVALVWELTGWPADITAFGLRWRPIDARGAAAGPWTALSDQPIEPGISRSKNLTNVEPNEARRRELHADLERRLDTGRASEVAPGEFIRAVQSTPAVLDALRIEIRQDPRRALLIGLGAIDRSAPSDQPREYGLFPVRTGGRTDGEPAATFVAQVLAPGDQRLQVTDLTIDARPAGTYLSWRYEEAKVEAFSIGGFNVYRAPAMGGAYQLLSGEGVAGPRVEGDWRHFVFADRTADESRGWTYAVTPRTIFGAELPARTEARFVPGQTAGTRQPRDVRMRAAGGSVSVSWSFDSAAEGAIAGFAVHRLELPDGALLPLASGLAPSTREFVDRSLKRDGTTFVYIVEADLRGGGKQASTPATYVHADANPPAAPSGLRGEIVRVAGRSYIRLRWNAAGAEHEIDGYALFADKVREGRVSRQASVPLVDGTEYDLEITAIETRTYVVGVAAVRRGLVGPMSQITMRVPGALESR